MSRCVSWSYSVKLILDHHLPNRGGVFADYKQIHRKQRGSNNCHQLNSSGQISHITHYKNYPIKKASEKIGSLFYYLFYHQRKSAKSDKVFTAP